jgi:hypothetical protein
MANTKTSLTADAGRWISEQIIESITEPDTTALDIAGLSLTPNQAAVLIESNRTNLYLAFGRPQSWAGANETLIINVPVTVSLNTAFFSQDVSANIAANDILTFESVNARPVLTVGPFSVLNVNSAIVTLNTNATGGNTSMLATRMRSGYDDVNVPNVLVSTTRTMFNTWNNMIGGKLLVGSDMSHVVPRYDWTSGQTYTRYNPNDPDLFTKPFYVMTSLFHVFKCLDNNGNSPSTVEPSTIPSTDWREVQITSDNYVWKYMFSLDVADTNFTQRFLTEDWMPIKALDVASSEPLHQFDVQSAAIDGSIDNIIMKNGGLGYVVPSNGPLNVSFLGGGGTGAEGTAVVSLTGQIAGITVPSSTQGQGYGSNLTSYSFIATANSNILTHTDTVIDPSYNGSYLTGNVIPANTYITQIVNTSSPMKVYLSANATANGSVGTPVISGWPRIAISGGGGSNAAALVLLTGDHIDTFNGSAIITNSGFGYVPPIVISIVGDGANAHAFVDDSAVNLNGAITNITLDANGDGYSNTTISISGGLGVNAQAYVVAGPIGGHGSDPVSELGAHSVMIAVDLDGDEGGNIALSLGNDYRQAMFLVDPFLFGTTNRANGQSFMQTRQIFVTPGVTNYNQDEVVFQTDSTGALVYSAVVENFDVANNILSVINVWKSEAAELSPNPDITLPLKGAVSTAFRNVITYNNPYLEMYSGRVIFVQNMQPIVRNADQVEYIRIVVNQFNPSSTLFQTTGPTANNANTDGGSF